MTLALNIAGVQTIYANMVNEALLTGLFKSVNTHEPKTPPTVPLHCAIFVGYIGPVPGESGLDYTTGLLRFNARVYKSFIEKPEDGIDPAITWACLKLMDMFSNDFTLGGNVKEIDLLGHSGSRLEATAGYITIADKIFRSMTVNVPVIVNDLWTQAA